MNLGAKAAPRTSQGFRLDGTLLSLRRAGVGADRRAVDQQLLPVGIARDASLQLGPDAALLPPGKTLKDIVPRPPAPRATIATDHHCAALTTPPPEKLGKRGNFPHKRRDGSEETVKSPPIVCRLGRFGSWRSAKIYSFPICTTKCQQNLETSPIHRGGFFQSIGGL